MHPRLLIAWLLALTAALLAAPARSQNPCTAPGPDCVVVGQLNVNIGLGVGGRTNPVHDKSDLLVPVIPHISYYGQRFFLENLEFGFTLAEGKSNTLSIVAAPGYDRAFFYRGDLQNIFLSSGNGLLSLQGGLEAENDAVTQEFPVTRRRSTYLVGPEWTFSYGQIAGQLNVLREVTGRHDGYEVRAAVAAPIINSVSSLVISTGLTWKSARLVRYYYGVEGLYEPGSAVNPFLKLGYTLPLSERWSFNAFAHYEHLGNGVADSPLISDGGVTTVFAGFTLKVL